MDLVERSRWSSAISACCIFGCLVLLRYVIGCIDPLRVDIHGGRKIVDAALESLAANFARKRAYTELLVHDGLDGILVVAEKAWEQVREGIALLGALGLARTLSFTHCRGGFGLECRIDEDDGR